MGRFYKADTPTFANNIIADLDTNLMKETLDVHDTGVENALDDAGKVNDLFAKLNNLKFDNEAVNSLRDGFNKEADELFEQIQADPANYMKSSGDIRNLSRRVKEEMQSGIFKSAQENLARDVKLKTDIEKVKTSGDVKSNYIAVKHLEYQAAGGAANKAQFNPEDKEEKLLAQVDENALINTITSNYKADSSTWGKAGKAGMFLTKKSGGKTQITEAEARGYMEDDLKNSSWVAANTQEVILALKAETGDLSLDKNSPEVISRVEDKKNALIDNAIRKIAYKQTKYDESQSVNSVAVAAQKKRDELLNAPQTLIEHSNIKKNGVLKTEAEMKLEGEKRLALYSAALTNNKNIQANLVTEADLTEAILDRYDEFIATGIGADEALKKSMKEYNMSNSASDLVTFRTTTATSGNLLTNREAEAKYRLNNNGVSGTKEEVDEFNREQSLAIAKEYKTRKSSFVNDKVVVRWEDGTEHVYENSSLNDVDEELRKIDAGVNLLNTQSIATTVDKPIREDGYYLVGGVKQYKEVEGEDGVKTTEPLTLEEIQGEVDTEQVQGSTQTYKNNTFFQNGSLNLERKNGENNITNTKSFEHPEKGKVTVVTYNKTTKSGS